MVGGFCKGLMVCRDFKRLLACTLRRWDALEIERKRLCMQVGVLTYCKASLNTEKEEALV